LALGALLFREGDRAGARDHYDAAIGSGHPFAAPNALHALGLLLEADGQLAEAISAYQSVLTFDVLETRQSANLQLARILAAENDLCAAADTLRSGVFTEQRTEYSAEAAYRLGGVLVLQGDLPGAQEAFRQAVSDSHPEISPFAALELGDVLQATGDTAAAHAMWRVAVRWNHPEVTELANARLTETAQE
jgi:predicted negative regulator of RcsB-dependent stress response